MNVVTLRPRLRRTCATCGIPWTPLRPTHRLCARCYRWHRVGVGIAITRRALEGTR